MNFSDICLVGRDVNTKPSQRTVQMSGPQEASTCPFFLFLSLRSPSFNLNPPAVPLNGQQLYLSSRLSQFLSVFSKRLSEPQPSLLFFFCVSLFFPLWLPGGGGGFFYVCGRSNCWLRWATLNGSHVRPVPSSLGWSNCTTPLCCCLLVAFDFFDFYVCVLCPTLLCTISDPPPLPLPAAPIAI